MSEPGSGEYEIGVNEIDSVLNCNIRDQAGMAVGCETPEAKLILERVNLRRNKLGLPELNLDKAKPLIYHKVEIKQFETARENVNITESTTTDMLTSRVLDRVQRLLETKDHRYFRKTDDEDILEFVENVDTSHDIDVANLSLSEVIELIKAGKVPNYIFVDISKDEDYKLAAQELGLTEKVEASGIEIVKVFDTGIRGSGNITEATSDGAALSGDRQREMGVVIELRKATDSKGDTNMDQLGLNRYPTWHIEELAQN